MSYAPYAVAVAVFVVGLYGIVTSRHYIHLVVSLSVTQSSTYLLLLAVGYKERARAPIFNGVPVGTPAVDPVVQALTLTDIVVGVAVAGLLLALAIETHKHAGTMDPDELHALRG
jgi:multicomponent Na+:H+ antiporter subunit C